MAVFIQREICCSVGFEDLTDANDFLYWGYEEHELIPCGTYDLLTGDTISYEHRGRLVGLFDPELIRLTAVEYLTAAARLSRNTPRPTGAPPGRVH